jgi:hypothetical protein
MKQALGLATAFYRKYMDENEYERPAYPVPDATIAGHPGVLVAVAAAILGVLAFWRKKKTDQSQEMD